MKKGGEDDAREENSIGTNEQLRHNTLLKTKGFIRDLAIVKQLAGSHPNARRKWVMPQKSLIVASCRGKRPEEDLFPVSQADLEQVKIQRLISGHRARAYIEIFIRVRHSTRSKSAKGQVTRRIEVRDGCGVQSQV